MQPLRVGRWRPQSFLLQPSRIRCPSHQLAFYSAEHSAEPIAEQPKKRPSPKGRLPRRSTQPLVPTDPRVRPPTCLAIPTPQFVANRRKPKKLAEGETVGSASSSPLDLPIAGSHRSAKLAALHARLSLPSKVPLASLARTLIDETADADPHSNNASLSKLGHDLAQYYMAEYLLCKYPRLPIAVLDAAQSAYVGIDALNSVVKEWGVEAAAEPGEEVDPGLLQFQWAPLGTQLIEPPSRNTRYASAGAKVANSASGGVVPAEAIDDVDPSMEGVKTLQEAAADFFQAVLATVHLHTGSSTGYKFFSNHVLSRHLDVSSLFTFTHPLKDLARLCAREGFEAPVARIISETGRLSVSPVFVVGIFSGNNMLGEGAGSSLEEARFKACLHALKGWYLYSPAGEMVLPSQVEGEAGKRKVFKAAHIDLGEVVV